VGDVVRKAAMAEGIDWPLAVGKDEPRRGVAVYSTTQLMGDSAVGADGERRQVTYQYPRFMLTLSERVDMYRSCSPVFGVVTGRMNRIAGLEWTVTRASKEEDRLAERLRECRALYLEYEDDVSPRGLGVKVRCMTELFRWLPELRRDLKNFDAVMRRWSRRLKAKSEDRCTEIEEWLRTPNQTDTFSDLIKKVVFDMHVHGAAATYKEVLSDRVENLYELPGGTVYPVSGRYVGDATGYVQLVDGFQPQLMFKDEVSFLQYAPRSDSSYGSIPLEALVNKVAESLLFDQRAAEMADGTKAPEKLIAFGDRTPFGAIGEEFDVPIDRAEQRRIEALVNEARKEAIRVITGYGTPVVVDVSRADTFQHQSERQRMVREEVGLVFGASNAEMNLTGSESTSGRETSETQERYDLYKGIYPLVQAVENLLNVDVLPYRFGSGFLFQYQPSTSEGAKADLLKKKKDSGLYSVNELRTEELGRDPFSGEQYDEPAPAPQQPPMGGPLGGL
jgi:hypothetical protein